MTTVASPSAQRIEGAGLPGVRDEYRYGERRIDHWLRLDRWCVLGAPDAFRTLDAATAYLDGVNARLEGARAARAVRLQTTGLGRAEKASTVRTRATEGEARHRQGGRWA